MDGLKTESPPPFPYSDARLLPYLQHSFWFLPNVAACRAMANLLAERHNVFWHGHDVVLAAGFARELDVRGKEPASAACTSPVPSVMIGPNSADNTTDQWLADLFLRQRGFRADACSLHEGRRGMQVLDRHDAVWPECLALKRRLSPASRPSCRREIRQILFDHLDQIGEAWEEYFKHDR